MNDCQITFEDLQAAENCPCAKCVEFRNNLTKDYREECDRLADIATFWQNKYYQVVPPFQRPNLDNL